MTWKVWVSESKHSLPLGLAVLSLGENKDPNQSIVELIWRWPCRCGGAQWPMPFHFSTITQDIHNTTQSCSWRWDENEWRCRRVDAWLWHSRLTRVDGGSFVHSAWWCGGNKKMWWPMTENEPFKRTNLRRGWFNLWSKGNVAAAGGWIV